MRASQTSRGGRETPERRSARALPEGIAALPQPSAASGMKRGREIITSMVDVFCRLSGAHSSIAAQLNAASRTASPLHVAGREASAIASHCQALLQPMASDVGVRESSLLNPSAEGPLIVHEHFLDGRLLTGTMRVAPDPNAFALASVLLPVRQDPIVLDQERRAFGTLLQGIADTLRQEVVPSRTPGAFMSAAVVDRCVPWGYVVVDEEDYILFANQRARAAIVAGCGIESRGGRLRALRSVVDRTLAATINEMAKAALEGTSPPSRVIAVPSADGECRFALKVTPCGRGEGTGMGTAYVFIIDLKSRLRANHEELACLFSLSDKESRFAELFCSGLRLNEIAAMMGITANTARVHLHNLFKKTGTSSQVELAWKLARVL